MTSLDQIAKEILYKKTTFKAFIESGNYLISIVEKRNTETGHYFFNAENMRGVSCRVLELAWRKDCLISEIPVHDEIYFITSEADRDSFTYHKGCVRAYTVRKLRSDGSIETIGDFQEHATKREAQKAIYEIVSEGLNQ